MDVNQIFSQVATFAGSFLPVLALPVGLSLAFHIFNSIKRAIDGSIGLDELPTPHITPSPSALSLEPEPQPESAPPPQSDQPSSVQNIITLIEYLRMTNKPSNCQQCGAPLDKSMEICAHCGSKV